MIKGSSKTGRRSKRPAKIRVAVVGCGYWGPNLARNFAACPSTELSMICDPEKSRLDRFAAMYPQARAVASLAEVLDSPDIDAVAIATPVGTHAPLALAASAGRKARAGGKAAWPPASATPRPWSARPKRRDAC